MGGPGSGNHWGNGAATTDDYRRLDVRRLARAGALRLGFGGGWQWTCNGEVVASIKLRAEHDRVVLTYRYRSGGDEWKDQQYPVLIARSRCHLGGSRPWFICPALGCGRRVAILYGGTVFACRQCHRLAYASSREDASDRATRRADRIRARLGWEPGILNGSGPKPRWMRPRTFQRLAAQHDQLVESSLAGMMVKLRLGGNDW